MRVIAPIYIQSADLLIRTKADVEILRTRDPHTYGKLLLSGDLDSFFYGRVMEEDRAKYAKLRAELVKKAENGRIGAILLQGRPLEGGRCELLTGKYPLRPSGENLDVEGYHVQKSVVVVRDEVEIDADEVRFSHVSFLPHADRAVLRIRGATRATFRDVIFGNVSLVFEDDASLHLDSVIFSGGSRPLQQRGDGRLETNRNVRFRGTEVNYAFERFDGRTAPTFDRYDPLVLREMLTYSQIDDYVLERDADFSTLGELEIVRSVRFRAPEDASEPIFLTMPRLKLLREVRFDKSVVLDADVEIRESASVTASLGVFAGVVRIESSAAVVLEDTVFALAEEDRFPVEAVDSDLELRRCMTNEIPHLVRASNAEIAIVDRCRFVNVGKLIEFYDLMKKEGSEKAFSREHRYRIEESHVEAKSVVEYAGSRASSLPKGEIVSSRLVAAGRHGLVARSRLRVESSILENRNGAALTVEGKEARLVATDSVFVRSQVGALAIEEAKARFKTCRFVECDIGAALSAAAAYFDGECRFEHDSTGIQLRSCGETCVRETVVRDVDSVFAGCAKPVDKEPDTEYHRVEDEASRREYFELLEKEGLDA